MSNNINRINSDYNYFFENNYALIDVNQDNKINNLYNLIYFLIFLNLFFVFLFSFKYRDMNNRIELLEKILSNFEIEFQIESVFDDESSSEESENPPLEEDPD